ncbi:phospholipase/Carboxylesterase [Colletotrichum asianum]
MHFTKHCIEPRAAHTHTVVFLHGRDSICNEFADELFESEASEPANQPRTLPDLLPSIRWVFPGAAVTFSERFGTNMSQWFDVWSLENPEEQTDIQKAGLRRIIIEELAEKRSPYHQKSVAPSINPPIFLAHTVDDEVIDISLGRQLRRTLGSFCKTVEWHEYDSGGHWVNEPQGVDDMMSFLRLNMH